MTYTPLLVKPSDDDEVIIPNQTIYYQQKKSPLRIYAFQVLVIVLLNTIIVVTAMIYLNSSIQYDCGTSPAKAHARGCHYDIMLGSWLPEQCYDKKLADEWSADEEGLWYHDQNFTQPFATSDLRKGQHMDAYTRWDFHLKHCLYTWERAMWNIRYNRMLEHDTRSLHHARHCTDILQRPDQPPGWTKIHTTYQPCVKPRFNGWSQYVIEGKQ
jgi:hypothetical protein